LFGGSTQQAFTEEISFDAIPTDGTAIVFSNAQEGGLEVIGVRLQRPDYTIDVALAVPEGCIEDDGAGETVLRNDGDCTELPVNGPIVGGGTTVSGDRIVSVRIAVNEECSRAVAFGSHWPTDLDPCAHS
jgi:hypothetical protein